ncbi:MAG TPA: hypothetical protein VGA61_17320 [Anaerolineae bacterium]
MAKKIVGSPLALIAGIGMFAVGGLHFWRLAVAPRLPGGKA